MSTPDQVTSSPNESQRGGKGTGTGSGSGSGSGSGYQSANDLVQAIANDPKFRDQFDREQLATLIGIADLRPPLQADKWIYRLVVGALALIGLATVFGLIYLTAVGKDANIPQGLVALGSAAVGAMAGLLAPSPAQPTQTTQPKA